MIASPVRSRIAQSYVPQQDDRPYRRGAPLAVAANVTFEHGSGCIASTPADMARYMSMFINRGVGPTRRILQEASFKALATAHMPPGAFGPNAGYGYGLAVEQLDGHTILWHTGGMVSFASAMHIDLDAGFGAFVSINAMQGYRPNAVARYALGLLRRRKENGPKPEAPSADENAITDARDYEGTYVSEDGERVEATGSNGVLLLSMGSKRITLRPQAGGQFLADEQEYELFPWVFGRARAQSPAGGREEGKRPVIELSWGSRWYGRSGHAAPMQAQQDQVPRGLSGLYYGEDPWIGSLRVVERRGRLWLNGETPLEPLGGYLFRFADEPASPETAEFLEFVDGQAQVLRVIGGELRRIPDLGWNTVAG
jgi:hypothetical protein